MPKPDTVRLDRTAPTWQDKAHGHPTFFVVCDNPEECQVAVLIATTSHNHPTKDLADLKSQAKKLGGITPGTGAIVRGGTTSAGAWPVLARHENAAEWLQIWSDLGRAVRTIDAYGRGLSEFLMVCERDGVDPVAATRRM